ncbi:MAG: aldo/keto reductase [Anaerotignum sp.]|nr:aldo/keto reductase [Anaerotignum sp.]
MPELCGIPLKVFCSFYGTPFFLRKARCNTKFIFFIKRVVCATKKECYYGKKTAKKLGLETSLLGFGCMRFPLTEAGKIDEIQSQEMLDYALASGVNYFDTAYMYYDNESEFFLGKAMEKHDRASFFLATKLPVWILKDRQDTRKVVEEQLRRLRTDYIDFYLLHTLDRQKWDIVLGKR